MIGTGFLVRPLDWVAFGPPKSSFGAESHERDTELPQPTAFQGMVRTALLSASGDDFSDRSGAAQQRRNALVGGANSLLQGWQLRGPFLTEVLNLQQRALARPWVMAPRFLLGTSIEPLFARAILQPSSPGALNDLSSHHNPVFLGRPEVEASQQLGGWLSPRGLRWALSGEVNSSPWPSHDHTAGLPGFVVRQTLPGISISDEGTAEDGQLFFAEVLRFRHPCGFAGWLSATLPAAIPANALVRGELAACGWRRRPVALEALPDLDPDFAAILEGDHLPDRVTERDGFYLTALTPVPCSHGQATEVERAALRLPDWPSGIALRVLGSLTGRPQILGGLEAASQRPRPNRSYWEAGSSWLVALQGGADSEAGELLRGRALKALNDAHFLGGEEASFGYGHTVVGLGPKLDSEMLDAAQRRQEGAK